MSDPTEPTGDAEKLVRALLGEWSRRDPRHPVPDFAREIAIVSIRDKTAYAGFLRCLLDVRTPPVAAVLPYRESEPPKTADKSDPWGLPSGLSRQFVEQETAIVAADPGEPRACDRCAGGTQPLTCTRCRGAKTAPCEACSHRGRKSCPLCRGRGSIPCALCKGEGTVVGSIAAIGTGNKEVCPQCTGKREQPCHDCADMAAPECAQCANTRVVACPACEGRGAPPCVQCRGSGRVVDGFSVDIAYKLAYHRSLLRDASIPEEVLPADPAFGKLGETVFEYESADAASFAAKRPEGPAGDAFEKVLAQVPAGGLGKDSRVILQSLSVERIPVYEVVYAFAGKEYRAWATRYQNRVVTSEDPFADLAARWAEEAESFLKKNEFALFEERTAKALHLAPSHPAVASLRGKAADVQRRAMLALGAAVSGGLALGVPAVLSLLYRSPNRFMPLAALALAMLGASLAAVSRLAAACAPRPLLPPSRRNKWAAGAAGGGAVLALALFLLIGPIRRIDAREFAAQTSRYAALDFADWGPDDDDALAALVADHAARGVDTKAGQDMLDGHASFLAVARARALREEQARKEAERAARLRAAEAKKEAARRKAADAKRLAERKKDALKAKDKKPKKKTSPSRR